jgi:hypothetical protein
MILILLAGFIPIIFLVEIGKTWYPAPDKPESYAGWAGFLAIACGLILGIALLATKVLGESGSWLVLLFLPSICALFAESLLYCFKILGGLASRQAKSYLRWPASLLLILPVMLAAFAALGDPFLLRVILFGGALLAFGWLLWKRLDKWVALSYPLVLILMLSAVWATDTYTEFKFLPPQLAPFAQSLSWIAPILGIILSFRILGWALAAEHGSRLRRSLLAGLLVLPIFLLLAWQVATASAWDVATDGLGGVSMLEFAFVFGVASAAHEAWSLPLKRSYWVYGLAALTLVAVMGAMSFGTFGFDGAWGNVPHARTARRAEQINRAILRYHAEQGRYPQALADLTPGYLLYLPTPFIIQHQDWCYQSGSDFYRLGYVYRDYFSTPASVKVFAAAGQPPDPSWPCDAEAAKYPAPH